MFAQFWMGIVYALRCPLAFPLLLGVGKKVRYRLHERLWLVWRGPLSGPVSGVG